MSDAERAVLDEDFSIGSFLLLNAACVGVAASGFVSFLVVLFTPLEFMSLGHVDLAFKLAFVFGLPYWVVVTFLEVSTSDYGS